MYLFPPLLLVKIAYACNGYLNNHQSYVQLLLKNGNLTPLTVKTENKHNAELQRTDPGTKVTGEFSTRGHIS